VSSSDSDTQASPGRGKVVGRVVELWRYPVKSMKGEAVDAVEVSWDGVAGDRRWAFVRTGARPSGFPWFTIRQRSTLVQYEPRFVHPERPDKSDVRVHTPTGIELDVADPALAGELGDDLVAIKHDRGTFDTLPISLITAQTLAALGESVGVPLTVPRFRPNLLVAGVGADDRPYAEDEWVGHTLQIGAAHVRIDKRDQRCVVVNVDPDTGERNPSILRAIAADRDACLGVYGQTARPGRIAVGDDVVRLD